MTGGPAPPPETSFLAGVRTESLARTSLRLREPPAQALPPFLQDPAPDYQPNARAHPKTCILQPGSGEFGGELSRRTLIQQNDRFDCGNPKHDWWPSPPQKLTRTLPRNPSFCGVWDQRRSFQRSARARGGSAKDIRPRPLHQHHGKICGAALLHDSAAKDSSHAQRACARPAPRQDLHRQARPRRRRRGQLGGTARVPATSTTKRFALRRARAPTAHRTGSHLRTASTRARFAVPRELPRPAPRQDLEGNEKWPRPAPRRVGKKLRGTPPP